MKMNKKLMKKYIIYILRWELSAPIVAGCLALFGHLGVIPATLIANFIGGLIFFWIDIFVFKDKK